MRFSFPRNTCEPRRSNPPQQPFSFAVNLLSIGILCVYLGITLHKLKYVKNESIIWILSTTYFSFIIFQSWHALSHYKMYDQETSLKKVQPLGAHLLTYIMAFFSFLLMSALNQKSRLTNLFYSYLIIIFCVLIDVYIVLIIQHQSIFMVFSGLSVLSAVFFTFYPLMPSNVRFFFHVDLFFFGIVLILEISEIFFCTYLQNHREWPYHMLLEIAGLLAFTFLTHTLYTWTRKTHFLIYFL